MFVTLYHKFYIPTDLWLNPALTYYRLYSGVAVDTNICVFMR